MAEYLRHTTLVILLPLLLLLRESLDCKALNRRDGTYDYGNGASSNGVPPRPAPVVGTRPPGKYLISGVVVAADGTGDYTTITDAVRAAPSYGEGRFMVHIKAGVYRENVEVPGEKTNIVFAGDGMKQTVLTSDRSAHGGWKTLQSATLAVIGNGFVARDMTIENSAGPGAAQAVALRSKSDQSVFYRCAIVGYQDTLFAQAGRQFFRECDVYGTIDFIFGRGSVVLQNCNLYAQQPLHGQEIIFTAQGKQDKGDAGGIVIHNCALTAASDLLPVEAAFRVYLGRPWKMYSTTVIMQSYLGNIIDPAGWLAWNGSFGLDTLLYMEYQNRGPGADTSKRVYWPGLRFPTNPAEVRNFTVSSFIQGDQWLPPTGVPYTGGLM
ncbi:hypothetical protein Taro_051208 [Colocasia esculenta]|uniref:Pectinesterase n=1 Tax=Colocasia esculenta TaxID=4460 RepID=A0A843XG68_COLES|nr:hypothetical protein [Colocasia esculenta]